MFAYPLRSSAPVDQNNRIKNFGSQPSQPHLELGSVYLAPWSAPHALKAMIMDTRQQVALQRLWGVGALRIFVSHTAPHKQTAKTIQQRLSNLGIASFVAHEDIEPMKEWEGEIEKALMSMDLLLALLTEDFGQSKWTDQEVGVAIGRKVHVIPVRIGKDPYGFMGKYQAIMGDLDGHGIANKLFEYVLNEDNLNHKAIDAFILAIKKSGNFNWSNELAKYVPYISELNAYQEAALVQAFNDNDQVNHAYAWEGIVDHLKRWSGNQYVIDNHQLRPSVT